MKKIAALAALLALISPGAGIALTGAGASVFQLCEVITIRVPIGIPALLFVPGVARGLDGPGLFGN